MELSLIRSQSEHSKIIQIKYLHLLVQEFAVRIDNGLINSVLQMFASEVTIPPYTVIFLRYSNFY